MAEAREHVEIERKYLLNGMPNIPPGAQVLRIEQGYLPGHPGGAPGGRVRRIEDERGEILHVHTTKTGTGMARLERERDLTREEFESLWPATAGRRLRKVRYRVRVGELVWEIDDFSQLGIVLAEVELPTAEHPVVVPEWVGARLVREVTDEPQFRNAELACRLTREAGA